jgi:glycogen synthase
VRILQQCIYFPPEVGGLESHAYYLCRELARFGHFVTMVTSRSQPGLPERESMDGVEVIRKWFPRKRTPAGWAAHTMATVPHYMRLAKRADILHAQTFASAVPGMLAKRRFGPAAGRHAAHLPFSAARPPARLAAGAAADHPLGRLAAGGEHGDPGRCAGPAPTPEGRGADERRGHDMFAPQPQPQKRQAPGRRRLIVPRRLFEKNGVEYFIRALPRVLELMDVEAVLVGDGPERGRLEALVAELGIGQAVTFLGSRPNTEMPALLAGADVAVFPSLMEATSVAALEAMSCGVPVAASRVGGLPEIVDEDVGTLFEPANPEAQAAALVQLLARGDLAARGARPGSGSWTGGACSGWRVATRRSTRR